MKVHNETYTDLEGFGIYEGGDHQPLEDQTESLYNWVFHFNEFTGLWSAIPRDCYNDYWSKPEVPGVLRSKSIDTLKEILYKTGGKPSLIGKLVREQ